MKPLFYDWPEGTLYFGSALMKSDAHAHSTHSMSEIRRLKINVFLAGRGQLVGFLVLSILASCYARAADVPVRQDDKERQEFLVHKVNAVQVVDDTFRFGAKIESERHLHHSFNSNFTGARVPASRSTSATKRARYRNANSQTETAVTSENGSSAKVPSIARRFELQKEPVASVARYDGMVQKDCASLHRTQQRSGDDFRHRTERGRSVIPQPSNHPSGASLQIRLEEAASELTADISQTEQQADQSVGSSASVRYTTPSSKSGRSNITFATTEHRRTTRIPRSEFLRDSSLNTPFGFIARNLWSLSGPSSAPQSPSPQTAKSTRKPPKKYKLATSTSSENKPRFQKSKSIAASEQPNTAVIHKDDGPFRIALPTISFPSPSSTLGGQESKNEKEKRATVMALRGRFKCPRESEVRFQLFPKICKMDKDCSVWNRDELCCEIFGAKSCVTGVPKPLEESSHTPFLGLIPRKCPTRPLAELWWDVKECDTDTDCWPRVCCPDGRRRYCRTSEPELEIVPVPVPVKRSFNYLTEYLECTPPPPPIFDLHPKACTSTFDCFPNVCCQEAGLRHCRPPKKSVLTLMANFLNVGFVKRLTQNIVIK